MNEEADKPESAPGITYGDLVTYGGRFIPQSGSAQTQEPVQAEAGARRTVEHRHMDLLEHSTRLGRLTRFDWSKPVAGLGALSLGAAFGALASDGRIMDTGVLTFGAVGVALLFCSVLIWKVRAESASDLKADFDRLLSFYDHEGTLREMREKHYAAEGEAAKRSRKFPRPRRARGL
jgi:hypothetical protein